MKKLFALLLTLALLTAMALPAFAADVQAVKETYTLTINNANEGHIYEAYQIFSGELAEVDGKQILSNIEWGTAVYNDANGDGSIEGEGEYDYSAELLAAIDASTLSDAVKAAADAASLAVELSKFSTDSSHIDAFAQVFGDYMDALNTENGEVKDPLVIAPHAASTAGDGSYTIAGLPAGYYLVKDQDGTLEGENDTYTKYIIHVLRSIEVTPKGEKPTAEKSINDTIDSTFNDYEFFDVNDIAYYKWQGTLPSDLEAYESYYYKFTDTFPTGIVPHDPDETTHSNVDNDCFCIRQIYIEGHDGNRVYACLDLEDTDTSNDSLPEGITYAQTRNDNGETVISLEFNDLKALYANLLDTHKIIVKYAARVTRDAPIAEAMTNSMKLEFSNNPNGDGKGETPEDVAHAFTFEIGVDKFETDKSENKLEGAEFVLYYERIEGNATVKYYAQAVTEEMIYQVDEEGNLTTELIPEEQRMYNGVALDANDIGVVYAWTTNRNDASILDTDANGKISIRGLDTDTYWLEETKAPAGYNLLDDPVKVVISAKYNGNENDPKVTVNYSVRDSDQGQNGTVHIGNSAGSTLPSTGGIGTTLFYVFGGLLFAGAAVLLVTKKRMADEA